MRYIIISFILCLATLNTKAQNVDEKLARKIAENYFNINVHDSIKFKYCINVNKTPGSILKVKNISLNTFKNKPSYYIVNMEGGGWLLVSADKRTGPIIAYSEFGYFDKEKLPENISDWITQYDFVIEKRRLKNIVIKGKGEKWKLYENENSTNLKSASATQATQVGPLLTSEWHQEYPFNKAIDKYSTYWTGNYAPNSRCLAGCSSVAIGQLLYYWGYAQGDYADYEFWKMPDNFFYSYVQEQVDATAYMIKSIGSTHLHSDYCYGGYVTTSTTDHTAPALSELGYNTGEYIEMSWWFPYDDWIAMIRTSINSRCPVIYRYKGKHEFICDGYQSDGKLHFNMGWNDAQCNLIWSDYEDLDLTQYNEGDYSDISKHNMFRLIKPNIEYTKDLNSIIVNNGENKTWQTELNLMARLMSIESGAKCQLVSGDAVYLTPGFWSKPGSRLTVKAYANNNLFYSTTKSAEMSDSQIQNSIKTEQPVKVSVFPNPTVSNYTAINTNGKGTYSLYNLMGKVVLSGNISSSSTKVNMEELSPGVYLLKMNLNSKPYMFKIIHN